MMRRDALREYSRGSLWLLPVVAVLVSVGLGNDYGHPNVPLMARLARGGARVLRTDQSGDLAAVTTSRGLAVVARGDPPRQ